MARFLAPNSRQRRADLDNQKFGRDDTGTGWREFSDHFYPLQGGSIRGFFLSEASSNIVIQVNYGQSQLTEVNKSQLRYIHRCHAI